MAKKKINFMCTALRDGFQSVYGARVFTKDFMPAVAAAREAGHEILCEYSRTVNRLETVTECCTHEINFLLCHLLILWF